MTKQDDEPDLVIKTNKEHGEADLHFRELAEDNPRSRDRAEKLLAQLHGKVVKVVDGVSAKGAVGDFIVAIRKRDFDQTAERLKRFYRNQDLTVDIEPVGR